MISFAILGADGIPTTLGRETDIPAGAVALPEGMSPDIATRMYVADGVWLMRPVVSVPLSRSGVDYRASWEGLPDGATATVCDIAGNVVLGSVEAVGGALEVHLPDPGQYEIDITAPRPWIGATVRVTSE